MGSAFVRYALRQPIDKVVTLDLLTYAGNLANLEDASDDPRHHFVHGDILNGALVEELIRTHEIDTIVHFAAESHVDRSIADPRLFYRTNVEGTISLLEVVKRFPFVHFHHISTDEVYGSIEEGEFTEESPYRPNSPYAASKAASDHFACSYAKTYGLSMTLSHSSNNFGPHQYPEKFIPVMIQSCLKKQPLPVYGKGINVRDWIFVDDHASAVFTILQKGEASETYNIGGGKRLKNLDLLKQLIALVAKHREEAVAPYEQLISFVEDRKGHDLRYAVCSKKTRGLGWAVKKSFNERLEETVRWCVDGK